MNPGLLLAVFHPTIAFRHHANRGQPNPKMLRLFLLTCLTFFSLHAAPALADIRYATDFKILENEALKGIGDTIRQVAEIELRKGQPVESLDLLRRRAEGDEERIRDVLYAEGYYDPRVTLTVVPGTAPAGQDATVTLTLDPGPIYRLQRFTLVFAAQGQEAAAEGLTYKALGVSLGSRARSEMIVAGERAVTRRLGWRGYPFARIAEREVVVDHADRSVAVDIHVDAGPLTHFGQTRVDGLEDVDASVVHREQRWKAGDLYDTRKVAEMRQALAGLDLFLSVAIAPKRDEMAEGKVPMTVSLAESKPRSIGGGVRYSTSQGAGVRTFWRHRNLFGYGENFRLEGDVAEQIVGAKASIGRPAFLNPQQRLDFSLYAQQEDVDAYDATRFGGVTTLTRQFGGPYSGSVGVSLEQSRIEDAGGTNTFTLIGLPTTFARNTTNDLLNPTRGGKLTLSATPYTGAIGSDSNFLILRLDDTMHLPFDAAEKYVLAGRIAVGSILGATRTDIPADKRFYAGGGDTVRGYAHQSVGPLDASNDPIGGASLIAGSIEMRARVTEDIGLVAFLDGGNVFRSELPDLGVDPLFGAGFGLRYYTAIGPLRLDLAFPLDRRPSDDAFQIYISLGQAF